MIIVHEISNGRLLRKPLNNSDMPLFRHCSEGMDAVTIDYFDQVVSPLLSSHNINFVEIVPPKKCMTCAYNAGTYCERQNWDETPDGEDSNPSPLNEDPWKYCSAYLAK